MAFRLGLQCIPLDSDTNAASPPSATIMGKKCTISGSDPKTKPATLAGTKAINAVPPVWHTSSPTIMPQGTFPRTQNDPPPLRIPTIPQMILTLSPRATLNLKVPFPPLFTTTLGLLSLDTITAMIQAAMGPAIKAAMAPYTAKLNTLEKATMPPLMNCPAC